MTKFICTPENIHTLGKQFLRKVRENMRGRDGSVVRFGTTGKGEVPNYQITFSEGRIHTRNGRSHDFFKNTEEFDSSHLSESFALLAIGDAIEKAPSI